jgi:hypothetical protein
LVNTQGHQLEVFQDVDVMLTPCVFFLHALLKELYLCRQLQACLFVPASREFDFYLPFLAAQFVFFQDFYFAGHGKFTVKGNVSRLKLLL